MNYWALFRYKGRYCKFSRTLPQTAWIVEGERKAESSIEDIMGDVLKKTTKGKSTFNE